MFARLVWIPLVLVACSKRADENRAVSATDTPGAKSDNGVGAPTPPTGDEGGQPEPLHVKGGGDGIGFMQGSRRVPNAASVRTGQPTVEGALDKETIRRYLRRNFPALRTCYEQRLAARAELNGTLTASFVIQPDGTVRDAKASGLDAEVESCFAKVIATIQFPPPKAREDVHVSYPFMLRVSDD
jgi:hypothetical protein